MCAKSSVCLFAVAASVLSNSNALAQGPSSRPVLPGPTIQVYDSVLGAYSTSSDTPIPDLFRMEAPFVERNLRLDYLAANHLHEPPTDESQFFAELSYSFTDRLGILIAAPLLIRNNFGNDDTSGIGDVEAGVRYVVLGFENRDPFKLALGINVLAPTGNVDQDLGEGQAFIEPEILLFQRVADRTFVQEQFSVGIPTGGAGTSTEIGWNVGLGHVLMEATNSEYFKFPTATLELNGATLSGGADAGTTVLDITPGLRWSIGSKGFGGVAVSTPITGQREFETQFIFSLIYRYGPVDEEGVDATSSRAYF